MLFYLGVDEGDLRLPRLLLMPGYLLMSLYSFSRALYTDSSCMASANAAQMCHEVFPFHFSVIESSNDDSLHNQPLLSPSLINDILFF